MPSWRTNELVPSLAERVAARLGLPFHPVVQQVLEKAPQDLMENSAQQFGNVDGAFAISGDVPAGPVFLIDDIVDSRWTLTVVGQLLRRAGSGPVGPLALRAAGAR